MVVRPRLFLHGDTASLTRRMVAITENHSGPISIGEFAAEVSRHIRHLSDDIGALAPFIEQGSRFGGVSIPLDTARSTVERRARTGADSRAV